MANDNESSPARTTNLLGTLPFRSKLREDPDFHLDVSIWRGTQNVCEWEGVSRCDTLAGIYYGSAEDEVTKFCPRHFYEMHFGPDAPYELVDANAKGRADAPIHEPLPPGSSCFQCQRPADPDDGRCKLCLLETEASEAFWGVIVRNFPKAKHGDLSPEKAVRQRLANVDAIEEWIATNVASTKQAEGEE